jgi:arginyl-tRNA synthetase
MIKIRKIQKFKTKFKIGDVVRFNNNTVYTKQYQIIRIDNISEDVDIIRFWINVRGVERYFFGNYKDAELVS